LDIKKYKLDNGLEIIFVNNKYTPAVSFQVWVKTGSRNEKQGITGISHMLEHMMFKGSKNFGPQQHAQIIQAIGGNFNAFTSNDKTVYFENVSFENLDLVVELESDRFIKLSLDKNQFIPERQVVYEERRMRTDNDPEGRAIETLFSTTFTAHPYHNPVIGWASDIEKWGIEDIKKFYKTWYSPNNCFIVVSGNFNTSKTKKTIEEKFSRWKPAKLPDLRIPKEPEQKGERRSKLKMDVKIPSLFNAYKIPKYLHPDTPVLEIIEKILLDGKSSRMYKKLFYEEQLVSDIGGGSYSFIDTGLFFSYFVLNKNKNMEKAQKHFFNIIENFYKSNIEKNEIIKAKNKLKADITEDIEKSFTIGRAVGESYYYTGDEKYYIKLLDKYKKINKKDIQTVAERYFNEDKRNIVELLPQKGESQK